MEQAVGSDISFGKYDGGVECHWQWNAKRIGYNCPVDPNMSDGNDGRVMRGMQAQGEIV